MAVKKTTTKSKEYAESIIDTVREPLIILDQDLRVVTASRSFYEFFKVKPEETVGQLIYDLGNRQWDIPKLRELLKTILPQKTTFDNYEVEHDFATIGRRTMLLNARQIQRASGKELIILLAIEDVTSRKLAEFRREYAPESLRENEERYKALFDHSPDLVFIFDFEGRFIDANAAALNRLGYTMKEIRSLKFASFLSKDQLPLAFKTLQEIQETGIQKEPTEFRLRHKNGSKVYVETTGSTIISKGKPAAILLIARDITVRKVMEEMLALKNVLLSTQQEASIDGILVVDENACILSYNRRFVELWGLPAKLAEDGVDEPVLQFVTSQMADPRSFLQRVQYLYEHRQETSQDELILADGRFFDRYSAPMIGSDKRYFGRVWYFRDITERKRAEEELRQSEEKYRDILENMQESYYELDLVGNLTFINNAVCRNMGYSKDELIGMNYRQYTEKEELQRVFQAYSKVYTTGEPLDEFGWRITRKDGTKMYIEGSVALKKDSEGKPIGFKGMHHDITARKQMEEELRQSEEKYRSILENIEDGYYETDLPGNYTFFNDSLCRIHGCSKEELTGMNKRQYTDKENSEKLFKTFNEVYKTGQPAKGFGWQIIRKDGTKRYIEASISLQKDLSGKPIGFRGITRDITERKQAEETIRQSEERYRTIIEQMEEGYFETDLPGNFTFVNDAECSNLGYPREELLGMNRTQYADEKNAKALYRIFVEVYKTGIPVKAYDLELTKKDGTKAIHEISSSLIKNAQGETIGFRGIARDITERKQAEEKIQYMATHDVLTGLHNRSMFSQRLNFAIQAAQRYQRQFAVLLIDLDRFKIINDTLGHESGDQLLQEIATRLKQSLRAVDVVGRLGGDEFMILIEEVNDLNQVVIVADKILAGVIKPITLRGQKCRITASIGICMYPKDAQDEQTLMKNADIAMYLAKEEGKNNYQFYSEDIQSKSLERLSIETNLRFALERSELSLHYQAKVDFNTNLITGVEALLRWHNPYLGSVTPTQFIPVAEETGMIVSIGRWVLKTACFQNVAWQQQGLPAVCMAVNLSLRQLTDDNLIDDIRTALNDSGMAPSLLEMEITESMVMNNPALIISILAKIKSMGVRLAIDDFGTGYSSLAKIQRFPIDTLKIDRSFIRNITEDAEDKAIAEAIIAMGKTLSLTVVAEGVETEEQMNFLKEHSCDEMQGYYFSKPIVPEQFADLLRTHVPSEPSEKKDSPR